MDEKWLCWVDLKLNCPLENNQFPLSLKVIGCSSNMIRVDVSSVCCLLLSAVTSSISSSHSVPLAVIHVHVITLTAQPQFQLDLQLLLLNLNFLSDQHTFKILSQPCFYLGAKSNSSLSLNLHLCSSVLCLHSSSSLVCLLAWQGCRV